MSSPKLPTRKWLAVLEQDYLRSFVRLGGAAVKVAVAEQEALGQLATLIQAAGAEANFAVADVSGQPVRLPYLDRVFNAVAGRLDWEALAVEVMRRTLRERYQLPDGAPDQVRVAELNGIDESIVATACEQLVTQRVIQDYRMAKDFRVAMSHLCLAAVRNDDLSRETATRVTEWLRGDLASIGALRRARIFERVNRYSARTMLSSAAHWVRVSGRAGLLVTVDVSRFATPRPTVGADGVEIRPPSRTAVADTYEMMRQCIDGTDESAGLLLVFLTTPEFITDERRGMRVYPALELRLADDVGDRSRGNPYAPMVRLEAT